MKSRKWFILIELILSVLVILCIVLMMQEKNEKKEKQISVIVQNSSDDEWMAFKYGIQMAADDMNVKVSFVNTVAKLAADEEIDIIKQEIRDGADALIVQPVIDVNLNAILKELEKKIPIMVVGHNPSMNEKRTDLPYTAPDNYAMGKALAEEILEDYNGDLTDKRLGIYQENSNLLSVSQRKQGLIDGLKDSGVRICWTLSDSTGKNTVQNQPDVDIVAAIEDRCVVISGEYSKENNLHGAVVYGIGTSEKSLYYLGAGIVKSIIVPDEFEEGYQSMVEVSQKTKRHFISMKNKTVPYRNVNMGNLFTEENEKILFITNQ